MNDSKIVLPRYRSAGCEMYRRVLSKDELPIADLIAESYAPIGVQKVVQGGNVCAPCVRYPPLSRVFVKERHFLHHRHVIPIGEDDQRQAHFLDVLFEFRYLEKVN